MKRIGVLAVLLSMFVGLFAGCSGQTTESIANQDQIQAEATGLEIHKIGVATYNVKDAQVMMFKDYLDNYIKNCFEDVSFIYSNSISNGDEMMDFLGTCADSGCEGVMFFYTQDLQKEVEFCAANNMYVIRPSGNVSDEEFQLVANNPYFLGEIGPGAQAEYDAALAMTKDMVNKKDSYIILSGGAFMGNEMHKIRTEAMLDTLQEITGETFSVPSNDLAMVSEATEVKAGKLKVLIVPGYMELETFAAPADKAIRSEEYPTVLSTIPVTPLMDALNSTKAVKCGAIDCFSEDNYFGFKKEKVGYVAGKYEAEIGPAFAALYNAIQGNADMYREGGEAFRLVQGYWTANDFKEYDKKYALSNGTTINAYNYEDLYSLVKSLNPDADFASFKKMVEAYSYEDCIKRRGL